MKDARIIGVGTTDELRPLLDQQTEVLDVHGRTVLPGFIDGHTHFQKGAVARHLLINWEGNANPESIPAALEQVRQRAAELPPGEWIRADGLRQSWLPEKRMPTRWEIDAVVADRPVILIAGGNHSISANSLALHLAGIDRDTPDPPGGIIMRDESASQPGS